MKKKKSKAASIHELAIALCEKRNVWFQNHTIRLVKAEFCDNPCNLCDMDCLCDPDMQYLCSECAFLLKKHCILKLVITT